MKFLRILHLMLYIQHTYLPLVFLLCFILLLISHFLTPKLPFLSSGIESTAVGVGDSHRSLPAEVSGASTADGWQTREAGRRSCGEPHCHFSSDPHSADLGAWSPHSNTKESEKPEASSPSVLQNCVYNTVQRTEIFLQCLSTM